jgi:ketosteroid isomerase-like protein
MSQENVESVRAMIEAFRNRNRAAEAGFENRDLAAAAEALHPEVEWDATRTPMDDLRGIYHGLDGVAEFWRRWLEAWDTVEFSDPELIDAGDHIFIWIDDQKMRGKGSGIEVDFPYPYGWVMTFRDRKIVRTVIYVDRREALEAAGLSK